MNNVIEVQDGFNGHTVKVFSEPIAVDGDLVKLRVAEIDKTYMFVWKHRSCLNSVSR